jgi:hypothetical protein
MISQRMIVQVFAGYTRDGQSLVVRFLFTREYVLTQTSVSPKLLGIEGIIALTFSLISLSCTIDRKPVR